MRVTRNMMFDNFLTALRRLDVRAARAQQQVSAGRKVLGASDDPVAAGRIQGIAADVAALDRLDRSAQAGRAKAELVDSALSEIGLLITEARVKAVHGGTTEFAGARDNLAAEVDSIREQILSTIAVELDGRYLTSGTRTDLPPFDATGAYQGNVNALTAEVESGETVIVAPTGASALQGTVDVLATLEQLSADLRSGNADGVRGAITALDAGIDHLSGVRGEVGIALQRIDGALNRRGTLRTQLLADLSELSQADLASILVDLAQAENAREVTLNAGARISGPTLFDFLR